MENATFSFDYWRLRWVYLWEKGCFSQGNSIQLQRGVLWRQISRKSSIFLINSKEKPEKFFEKTLKNTIKKHKKTLQKTIKKPECGLLL